MDKNSIDIYQIMEKVKNSKQVPDIQSEDSPMVNSLEIPLSLQTDAMKNIIHDQNLIHRSLWEPAIETKDSYWGNNLKWSIEKNSNQGGNKLIIIKEGYEVHFEWNISSDILISLKELLKDYRLGINLYLLNPEILIPGRIKILNLTRSGKLKISLPKSTVQIRGVLFIKSENRESNILFSKRLNL